MRTTDAELGEVVRTALDAGRAKAIHRAQARAGALAVLVLDLAHADALAGRPARGRAGRIARKLGCVSERRVRQILSELLSCVSD